MKSNPGIVKKDLLLEITHNYIAKLKQPLSVLNPFIFISGFSCPSCIQASLSNVWWHDATLFVYFSYFITYIHTFTFIQYIYPSPFAEASLHFFIACLLSWGTSLWCRAENRTRACLAASRRATNWATPHHNWATPHHYRTPHYL